MKPEESYLGWIAAYKERYKHWTSLRGLCFSASQEMVLAFPELRLCRGFAYLSTVGWHDQEVQYFHEQHWWCEAPHGMVLDPTASQYDRYGGVLAYVEYDEAVHDPLPIGKCMNCGSEIYAGEYSRWHCTRECELETMAELNG